jgi:CheY-like chemotaxis protein
MSAEKIKKRILLAEDDDDDHLIFSLAMEDTKLAVELTRATTGELLLKKLNDNIPDILFLDLLLPCKDGRQCLKEIRSNSKYDELPIIIYSFSRDFVSVDYCFQEGGNFYIAKPGSVTELSHILKKVLLLDWKKSMYYPSKSKFILNPLA